MQPVFRLIEYHRMRAIHDRACHLLVAVRRQAMHEKSIRLGQRHQRIINLIGAQLVVAPLARRLAVMHRDPSVGHQEIRAAHRFLHVPLYLDLHAFGPRRLNEFRLRIQRRWARKN